MTRTAMRVMVRLPRVLGISVAVFLGLAGPYAFWARHLPSWILAISGPLAIVGVLNFVSLACRRGAAEP